MKHLLTITCACLALLPIVIAAGTLDRLIIVEIREYADRRRLPVPPALDRDMQQLAGMNLVAPTQCVFMSDEDDGTQFFPMRSNLQREFERVAADQAASLVFHRGRGVLDAQGLSLLPADGQGDKASTHLSFADVAKTIDRSGRPALLLLEIYLDGGPVSTAGLAAFEKTNLSGTGVVCAIVSGSGELTPPFSAVAAAALRGAADFQGGNKDGVVSVDEAVQYIRASLAKTKKENVTLATLVPAKKAQPLCQPPVLVLKHQVATAEARAGELAAARKSPGLLARAATAWTSGQTILDGGNPEAAEEAFKQALSCYNQAIAAAVRTDLDELLAILPEQDVAVLGGPEGSQLCKQLSQARSLETKQSLAAAADIYFELAKLIPDVRGNMAKKLSETARRLAAKDTYPTALAAAEKALLLEPESAQLQALIARLKANFRFEPGKTHRNAMSMVFAYLPPSAFTMGSPAGEAGREADETEHKVTLSKGFFLGIYEITQSQWSKVMADESRGTSPIQPVTGVTLPEALDFCRRLSESDGKSYRLPTEAEWEYACRAGTRSAYHYGAVLSGRTAAVYDPASPLAAPAPVGSYVTPNPWGLFDMHGNVWEWCADDYRPYPSAPVTDPGGIGAEGVEGKQIVLRGGSWFDDASMARSANRWASDPLTKNAMVGFRVVLAAEDVE